MLIMSIGKLVNLLEKREVEQKTNKLLILSVELILLSTSQHKRKNLFIKKSQHKNEHISSLPFVDIWHLQMIMTRIMWRCWKKTLTPSLYFLSDILTSCRVESGNRISCSAAKYLYTAVTLIKFLILNVWDNPS